MIQQRRGFPGGFGREAHERHADLVADAVARGSSLRSLLGPPVPRIAPKGRVVQFQDHDEEDLRQYPGVTIRDRPHGPLEDPVPARTQGRIFEGQHLEAWEQQLRREGWDTHRGPRPGWPDWLREAAVGVPQIDMVAVRVSGTGILEVRVCDVTRTGQSPGSFDGRPMAHADATRLRAEALTARLQVVEPDLVFEVTWQERYWESGGRVSPVVSAGTSRRPIVGPEPRITDQEQERRGQRRGRRRRRPRRSRTRARAVRTATPIAALAVFLFSTSISQRVSALADDLRRRDDRRTARVPTLDAYNLSSSIERVFGGFEVTDEELWRRRQDFSRFRTALAPLQRHFVRQVTEFQGRLGSAMATRNLQAREDQVMDLDTELFGRGPVGLWRRQFRARPGGLRLRAPGPTVDATPGLRQYIQDARYEVRFLMTDDEAADLRRRAEEWRSAWDRRSELVDLLVHDHYADPLDASYVVSHGGQVAAGIRRYVAGLRQTELVIQTMLSSLARLETVLARAMESLHGPAP